MLDTPVRTYKIEYLEGDQARVITHTWLVDEYGQSKLVEKTELMSRTAVDHLRRQGWFGGDSDAA